MRAQGKNHRAYRAKTPGQNRTSCGGGWVIYTLLSIEIKTASFQKATFMQSWGDCLNFKVETSLTFCLQSLGWLGRPVKKLQQPRKKSLPTKVDPPEIWHVAVLISIESREYFPQPRPQDA